MSLTKMLPSISEISSSQADPQKVDSIVKQGNIYKYNSRFNIYGNKWVRNYKIYNSGLVQWFSDEVDFRGQFYLTPDCKCFKTEPRKFTLTIPSQYEINFKIKDDRALNPQTADGWVSAFNQVINNLNYQPIKFL